MQPMVRFLSPFFQLILFCNLLCRPTREDVLHRSVSEDRYPQTLEAISERVCFQLKHFFKRSTKGNSHDLCWYMSTRGLRVTTLKPSPSLSPSHSPKNRSESESESLSSHVLRNVKTAFLNFSN